MGLYPAVRPLLQRLRDAGLYLGEPVIRRVLDLAGESQWSRDIEVELRFLTTAEGGRKGPAHSGYRPQVFYDGRDWDANHEYPDVERANPGDTVRAYLCFLSPQEHEGKLVPGKTFQIREGQKVVAEGRVLRVLELPESAARAESQE